MLRMSSWTITVLPVPAPPKSPIFEPLANVQIRSITLIPVSRISTLACCSEIGGAGLWIGHLVPPSGVGSSSIELPTTLNIRPRVSTPTGTDMEAPVACTGSPRRMPSVASMAMHRTTLSPMSDETSRTIFRPSTVTSRASNSSGWSPGPNSTSTTAPMTWLIRPSRGAFMFGAPCACPASAFSVFCPFALVFAIRAPSSSRARGLGAAHDLHQLGGDSGLSHFVRVQRQRVDQVTGGVGGVLHRDHLRRVLACLVREHTLKHLRLDVPWQQAVKHCFWLRLVDVVGSGPFLAGLAFGDLGGDQDSDRRLLAHGRDPFRVAEKHGVGVPLRVLLQRDRDGRQHEGLAGPVGKVADLGDDVAPITEQEVAPLAAERHVALLLRVMLVHVARRRADVVDVDRAAKAAVGCHEDHDRALALAPDQERVLVLGGALADRLQDLDHLVGVRPRRLDGGLRLAKPRRRHHLHRLRDLLRVLDRVDATDDVA